MSESPTGRAPGRSGRVRVRGVIALTAAAAVLIGALAWFVDGPPHDYVALAVLAILASATRVLRVRIVNQVALAASGIVSLASCVLVGPFGSALIMVVAILVERSRGAWQVKVFNGSLGVVLGALGGLVYLWSGGPRDLTTVTGPMEVIWRVGGPFLVASLAFSVVNFAWVALIVWVDAGEPFKAVFRSLLTTSGLAQMGYSVIGLLLIVLWVPAAVGPFSAVLILVPLFVAHWAFVQYAEEQRAHERTLAALVTAGETRDPYAEGHGERVAKIAVLIGDGMGLSPAQKSALRYAAILHDIGWLGVRNTAVRHGSLPDANDREMIRGHSGAGVALLRDISFLQDSLDGIGHHHERWDGRGYPDGLAGEDIPIASRIIAVADAFDSLTRARPGWPALGVEAALVTLTERAGTHLDPGAVAVLTRVIERHTLAAAEPPTESGPPQWHHDDPAMSDLLAALTQPVDGAEVR